MRWPGMPLYFTGTYTSLSVGPGASMPPGHRLAAVAVSSAMQAHARECRRGNNPYEAGLTERQLRGGSGPQSLLRLVPKSERHRALIDVRELLPSWQHQPHAVEVEDEESMEPPRSNTHQRSGACLLEPREPSDDSLMTPLLQPDTPPPSSSALAPPTPTSGGDRSDGGAAKMLPRVELSRYDVIDEEDGFIIEVRLKLPEAVPSERVRVAFSEQSVEVWAAGDVGWYRFFVAKLYKPIIVDRCKFKVSQKAKRITVLLHKYDNSSWRFLKG